MTNIIVVIILVVLSGIFSGLTIGYFSLNKSDLKRKADLGDKNAKKVYAIRKRGNLLLCTLLVGNVAVNSAISIFLGTLTSGLIAGLSATSLIVVFGEILPQATFARYALITGARFSLVIKFFIIVLFPICFPIAWLLDKMLGEEMQPIFSKDELVKLVEEHEASLHSDVDADEEKIIKGALLFSRKKVKEAMLPWKKVHAFSADDILTPERAQEIRKARSSRIPVYKKNKDDVVGILFVKDLVDAKFMNKPLGKAARKKVIYENENERLDDVLNKFRDTRNHLFIVRNKQGSVTGIITMEDVLEEIIGAEIEDEFDEPVAKPITKKKKP